MPVMKRPSRSLNSADGDGQPLSSQRPSKKGNSQASGGVNESDVTVDASAMTQACNVESQPPASGEVNFLKNRRKLRVSVGLYNLRYWVYPWHVEGFRSDLKKIKAKKTQWAKTDIREYKELVSSLIQRKYGTTYELSWGHLNSGARLGTRARGAADGLCTSQPSTASFTKPETNSSQPAAATSERAAVASTNVAALVESQPSSSGSNFVPASGGIPVEELERRFEAAFKPFERVELLIPCDTVVAKFVSKPDAAIAYMQTDSPGGSSIQFLPQDIANWLYQASHYAVPLIQSLLGTGKAFDGMGRYVNLADSRPASGGQVVACWGTEMAARTERALFSYDVDTDW